MMISKETLNHMLDQHKKFFECGGCGERFEFHGDLSYADLGGASLSGAVLNGVNLSNSDMHAANLFAADLRNANLSYANLRNVNLTSMSRITGAILYCADLRDSNLTFADLRGVNLSGANLEGVSLKYVTIDTTTTMVDVKGIISQKEYMDKNFDRVKDGYIVYKIFGLYYPVNDDWRIAPGSIIEELNCNMDRRERHATGINVGTCSHLVECAASAMRYGCVWKCIIRDEWLDGVCVPYTTDGGIRCNKLELIRII